MDKKCFNEASTISYASWIKGEPKNDTFMEKEEKLKIPKNVDFTWGLGVSILKKHKIYYG